MSENKITIPQELFDAANSVSKEETCFLIVDILRTLASAEYKARIISMDPNIIYDHPKHGFLKIWPQFDPRIKNTGASRPTMLDAVSAPTKGGKI